MARLTLREILNHYPILESHARRLANVHASTWRRWKAGTANPPAAIVELIRLYAAGRILPECFGDCYFSGNVLFDDYGHGHTLADLRLFTLYRKHSGEYIALLRNYDLTPKPTAEQIEKGEQLPPFKIHAVK